MREEVSLPEARGLPNDSPRPQTAPMAKRKGKRTSGGAFGGPQKPRPALVRRSSDPLAVSRGTDPMLRMIQRLAEEQDFKSEEDFRRFMDENVVGKTPEELAAMLSTSGPRTPDEEADLSLSKLPHDPTPDEAVVAAKQALEISEGCVTGWLILASHAESARKALEFCDQGIARGRQRFAKRIAKDGPERGLWGWIDARDFMRLFSEKARVEENLGDYGAALTTYQEMLQLNPGDNQGVRGDALRLLMATRKVEEARALLNQYPDDGDCAMAWGQALVAIVEAADRTGYQLPDTPPQEFDESPQAFLKSLGPDFAAATRSVKRAIEVNRFVPLLFTRGGLMQVVVDDRVLFGWPYQAVAYLQKWGALWHLSGLPMVFLTACAPKSPKKYTSHPRMAEELADVMDQLDSYIGRPWWELLHGGEA